MIDYVICMILNNLLRMIHEYVLSRNEAGSFSEVSSQTFIEGFKTWRMINSK
jgi:hypothetical protein